MRRLEPRDRCVIIGNTGFGKTTYVQRSVQDYDRVIVWDPKREYGEPLSPVGLDALLDAPGLDAPGMRLAVRPRWRAPADLSEAFNECVQVVSTLRDYLLVVDEVGLLDQSAHNSILWCACQSRDWGAPLILVAQRAVQIPVTAREQASLIVAFRQQRPADVDALVDRCGEAAARVAHLPLYEPFVWDQRDDLGPTPKPPTPKKEKDK